MTGPGAAGPEHWHAGWYVLQLDLDIAGGDRPARRARLRTEWGARAYLARRLRQVAATADTPAAKSAAYAAREDLWYGGAARVVVAGMVYELHPCPGCARWEPAPAGTDPPRAPAAAV